MNLVTLIRRLPLLALLTASAWAGPAHQHGIARVDLALDGAELTIALEMPLDSLLGFERAPRTPAERQAAQAALARLRDGAALWRPDAAAQCTLQAATVSAPVLERPGAAAGAHADVDAEYRFRCAQPARLAEVDVRLFEAFSRLERVDVQTALPSGQRQARLSRSQPRLRLAP
ncbi:DUF2796 domain-containing protein [Ideonella sp. 4Y11]|uniref:DUF2796 domain-containing protein n=1 Tax=Ideonella aquatica TaxID=2824119 RepID=A0A940YHK7_9BURK|nr:DUF2796 domain-containing protein [Ideonella aquatica]MBQ0960260.1 DUF2796 domain-containing protein [Ideonella aquatica]